MKNSSKRSDSPLAQPRRANVARLEGQIEDLRRAEAGRNVGLYRAVAPAGYKFQPSQQPLIGMGSDERLHLLLPVPSLRAVREDHESTGVVIVGRELLDGAHRQAYADLECRSADLMYTFILLMEEVLSGLEGTTKGAVDTAHEALSRWRDLLVKRPVDRLSPGALAGLFGELLMISDSPRPKVLLDAWSGPDRTRHDFRVGTLAIEIKTTLSSDGQCVVMHGISQLEPPADGELILLRYRLEKSPTGRSIPDLVASICAANVDLPTVYRRLADVGYSREDEAYYKTQKFTVRARDGWKIAEGFPCICASSFVGGCVPPGTRVLDYELDLSSAQPWRIADEELAEILKGHGIEA